MASKYQKSKRKRRKELRNSPIRYYRWSHFSVLSPREDNDGVADLGEPMKLSDFYAHIKRELSCGRKVVHEGCPIGWEFRRIKYEDLRTQIIPLRKEGDEYQLVNISLMCNESGVKGVDPFPKI